MTLDMKRKAKFRKNTPKKESNEDEEFTCDEKIERCFACLQEGLNFTRNLQVVETYNELLHYLVSFHFSFF